MQPYFFIRNNRLCEKINYQDIVLIRALKNYTQVVTEKKTFLLLVTMKKLEAVLPPTSFCRVHRSFIVSLDKMTSFDYQIVNLPGHQAPIGDQYRHALEQRVTIVSRDHVAMTSRSLVFEEA